MKNIILVSSLCFTSIFVACNHAPKTKPSSEVISKEKSETKEDLAPYTLTDNEGKTLTIEFNHKRDQVSLNFNGENIILQSQKPASGIWYKNDLYELRGKGNDVELTKEGKVIFTHNDEIITAEAKDKSGQTLYMEFNNTVRTATLTLGEETIELVDQKPASGMWYKNDHYEFRGKGEKVELSKDGKIIFQN